jgi:hypothetical protein
MFRDEGIFLPRKIPNMDIAAYIEERKRAIGFPTIHSHVELAEAAECSPIPLHVPNSPSGFLLGGLFDDLLEMQASNWERFEIVDSDPDMGCGVHEVSQPEIEALPLGIPAVMTDESFTMDVIIRDGIIVSTVTVTPSIHIAPSASTNGLVSPSEPDSPSDQELPDECHLPYVCLDSTQSIIEALDMADEDRMASECRFHRIREMRSFGFELRISETYMRLLQDDRERLLFHFAVGQWEFGKLFIETDGVQREFMFSSRMCDAVSDRRVMEVEAHLSERMRLQESCISESNAFIMENNLSHRLHGLMSERSVLEREENHCRVIRVVRKRAQRIIKNEVLIYVLKIRKWVTFIQCCVRGHLSRQDFIREHGLLPREIVKTRIEDETRLRLEIIKFRYFVETEIDAILEGLTEVDIDEFLPIDDVDVGYHATHNTHGVDDQPPGNARDGAEDRTDDATEIVVLGNVSRTNLQEPQTLSVEDNTRSMHPWKLRRGEGCIQRRRKILSNSESWK